MPYVITQKCVGTCDTACVDVCPCNCIVGPVPLDELRQVPESERGARFPGIQMFIDPDECIDCGACEPACPVSAIFPEDSVPDNWKDYIAKNADYYKK